MVSRCLRTEVMYLLHLNNRIFNLERKKLVFISLGQDFTPGIYRCDL